jgi:tetratricopeptide (TPR) repeat protein
VFEESDPPTQSINLGVPHVESSTSQLKIPDGWGVVLPEAVHSKCIYATYDETYRFEKGVIYTDRKVEILRKEVPVEDWKTYKKWTDSIDLSKENYIQLTNTGASAPDFSGFALSVDPLVSSAGAQKLIKDAYEAVQRHDLSKATADLDQAQKLDPDQELLWTTYGYLELARFQIFEAIEDFEKELAKHPNAYQAYPPLIQSQVTANQRDKAVANLRKWAVVQPDNPQPTTMLVSMLIEQEDYQGAISVAKAGIAGLPESKRKDERLQLALGRAQLKAKQVQAGHATLAALLKSTTDPGMMNDCAYDLADAGLELPLAESTARAALDKVEQESQSWTLNEDPESLLRKSRQITANWDTVGWILFRKGELERARDYVSAAWKNQLDPVVGEHLGEIDEARGHKEQALADYELALAAVAKFDAMGVRKAPGSQEKLIEEHIKTLNQAGFKSPPAEIHAHPLITQARTLQLGPAEGAKGSAEYRFLLKQGKAVKVEATGSSAVENGEAKIQQGNFTPYLPKDSKASLVKKGFLNCLPTTCELVLEP